MSKKLKPYLVALYLFGFELGLLAQDVDLSKGAASVKKILVQVASVILALVGLMGIGRAAYKFSTGDHDAATSLLTGIVATILALVAQGFAGK